MRGQPGSILAVGIILGVASVANAQLPVVTGNSVPVRGVVIGAPIIVANPYVDSPFYSTIYPNSATGSTTYNASYVAPGVTVCGAAPNVGSYVSPAYGYGYAPYYGGIGSGRVRFGRRPWYW